MFNWNKAFSKPGFVCEIYDIDSKVTPKFVKELRKKLNVSQRLFSKILGISIKTVEKWEQGANPTKGTASRLLYLLDKYDFLMNDLYEVNKSEETNQVQNQYQIKMIPKEHTTNKSGIVRYIVIEPHRTQDLSLKGNACNEQAMRTSFDV